MRQVELIETSTFTRQITALLSDEDYGAFQSRLAANPGLGALIKGGGGKLLREKIVASASKCFVIVADESKQVEKLGRFPLPVEVIQMAAPLVSDSLQELGFTPTIRLNRDGTRYITDEGNLILDCSGLLIDNPEEIAARIDSIIGVVEHGLFLGMADLAVIAGAERVIERTS